MKPTKLIGILLFLILSVMANAISVTDYGAKTSSGRKATTFYIGDRYSIFMNWSSPIDSRLEIRISGYTDCTKNSVPLYGGQKYWNRTFSSSSYKEGGHAIYFHAQNKSTGECRYLHRSVYLTFKKKQAKVTSFYVSPSNPTKGQSITLTAKTDISASNVKIKCGNGSWHSASSSNGNRTWTYRRYEGLQASNYCYVDGDGDGRYDKRIYVNVKQPTPDRKPTISIKFFPTTVKKTFNSRVSYSDDKGLTKISCKIYKYGNTAGNHLKYDYKSISGTSYSKNWSIDVSDLPDGKYEVMFFVSDGKTGVQSITKVFTKTSDVDNTTNNSELIRFLNRDSQIRKMNLAQNSGSDLSRSDAVVLIDRMRILLKSSIKKDMSEYYNPFADVPQDAEYLPSLMRLAYYKSSSFRNTVVTKYNQLFNPMRHMSREEFIKVALNAFEVPQHSADLSAFSDRNDMSDWAKKSKYFETAVYYGIIVGNKGKLLARDPISINEALIILRKIKSKFPSNFSSSRYETAESLNLDLLYHKTIGFEYEPRYYKPNANPPINITSVVTVKKPTKDKNYYILAVNSKIDTSNGASDYYWWSTDKGYFKKEPSSSNYKKVRFYPMSTKPSTPYHITVNGGDNLGYVDSQTLIIGEGNFSYPESSKVASGVSANLSNITLSSQLIANKLFTVDLTHASVKKTNIELGIDQVTVSMIANGKRYELFHGTPNGKKARFVMGDYPELYGKDDIKLSVEVYSQDKKYSIPSKKMTYIPQFTVRGKVYNAVGGTKVTKVRIGSKEIALDENGEFYYTLDSTSKTNRLQIRTKENSQQNHFDPVNVELTYTSPSKYVVLTGEDARPSLNLMVSPIHVPSNKSVKFTLTSDKTIPSNATIDLEGASCGRARGLGGRKVEITCTTPSTNSIKYITMSISSNRLYGDGLSRTIVVDKGLNQDNTDTDGDGQIDSKDLDDDNDGISDIDEIKYGLNPLNANDAHQDSDGDGVSNVNEIKAGTNPNDNSDYPNNNITKKLKWRAFVSSLYGYIEEDEKLSDVIKNGVMRIAPSLSNKSYYWTNFYLDLPKVLDGDNIKFETRIKCPSREGGLSAYDTAISVLGSVDKDTNKSAWLTLMDGDWAQSYDSFGAVDTSIRNIPQLVKDLQGWHTIAVQTKNGKVSVYYDNQVLKESDYTGSVGKLIRLRISFKGSGTLDWAKLYQNEKLVLEESFDVDGETTATLNKGINNIVDTDRDGIPNSEDLDDDGDGISDIDEEKYGLNPLDDSDALIDSDGDGFSNLDEINAGTNPLDKSDYPKENQTRYMKVAWFANGQNIKVIPEGIKGKIVGLFTWWGDHSIRVDLNNDGIVDYDFNEDYYNKKDVSSETLNLKFNNGFSLQDYELWTDYWEDPTHGQVNCWDTNSDGTCKYKPNGVGALFYIEDNNFECKNNIWRYRGELVNSEEIYCIEYENKVSNDKTKSNISKETLANLYFATIGRTMSSAGLDYWTNTDSYDGKDGRLKGTNLTTIEEISASFAEQIEYKKLYPDGTSNEEFVNQIFQNLFQRDAASSWWADEITAGHTTRTNAVLSIIYGAKGDDAKILKNRATVAIDLAENYNISTEVAKNKEVINALKSVTSDNASIDKVKNSILFFINF